MNRESFYLEIGNIDDDLIQEASEAHGHKVRRISFIRLAGIAACLCLICTAALFGMRRDAIYYNEAPAPHTSKVLVPSDENTTVLALTYQELFDYYGLEPFPDVLSGLQRLKQTHYYVYQSPENTVYDTNILNYRSDDGTQTLTIVLSKNESDSVSQQQSMKKSRIDGIPVVLAVSNMTPEQTIYWAEICNEEVYLRIVASGMDKPVFTDLIYQIVQFQK